MCRHQIELCHEVHGKSPNVDDVDRSRSIRDFVIDLAINLRLVVEVATPSPHEPFQCKAQIRVLMAHLVDRPAVFEIIHHDLGHSNSR